MLFEREAPMYGSYDVVIAGGGPAPGPARIMSTCMAMGEAAGVATVLKLRDGVDYKNVNMQQLRLTLRDFGAQVDA